MPPPGPSRAAPGRTRRSGWPLRNGPGAGCRWRTAAPWSRASAWLAGIPHPPHHSLDMEAWPPKLSPLPVCPARLGTHFGEEALEEQALVGAALERRVGFRAEQKRAAPVRPWLAPSAAVPQVCDVGVGHPLALGRQLRLDL